MFWQGETLVEFWRLRLLGTMRGVCAVALLVSGASFAHVRQAVGQEADVPALTKMNSIPATQEEEITVRKKRLITDPYAAIGVNAGGLRLFPVLEIGTVFSSNAAKSATKPHSDIGLDIKPSLRFESDWSRHSWTGSATADWQRFKNEDDLSTLTGAAETAFRLDIRHTTHADFTASYALNETGSENSQVPKTAASARRDHSFTTSAGLTHDFGGLETTAKLSLARGLYEDVALVGGGTEKNADRDYWEPTLSVRATLGYSNVPLRPFVEAAYAPRFHDQTLDRNTQNRNAQGLALSAGVSFDDGPIWTGDVAMTYLRRSYDDAALQSVNALGVTANVTWRPTPITTILATTGLSFDEASAKNISASRNWTSALSLTQAVRDNVDLLAGASLALQKASSNIDITSTAKLGLDWKVNPNMTAGLTYQGTWFAAGSGTGDYNEQRLMSSIILKQ
jgi:hypothetical protein